MVEFDLLLDCLYLCYAVYLLFYEFIHLSCFNVRLCYLSDCNWSSSMHYVTEFIGRKGRGGYSGGVCTCGRMVSLAVVFIPYIMVGSYYFIKYGISENLLFNCQIYLLISYTCMWNLVSTQHLTFLSTCRIFTVFFSVWYSCLVPNIYWANLEFSPLFFRYILRALWQVR